MRRSRPQTGGCFPLKEKNYEFKEEMSETLLVEMFHARHGIK